MLSNVRIVLVNTSHPGNIGAVARAMKNMCLTDLRLVQPRLFPHAEASARASGADDLLNAAQVCTTLEEAIAGCALVVGASARQRHISWPQVDARECGALVARDSPRHPVAIVFGREDSGLTNDELGRCHYLTHIPVNPQFSSLNVAAAVQVIAYEIFVAQPVAAPTLDIGEAPMALAGQDDMERLYEHLEKVMVETGFLDPQQPKFLMHRLRRLFGRARPDVRELNILRGILTSVQKSIR